MGFLARCGIGDVALNAFHCEFAAHGAAPAIFDHVAGALDRGGLAHDAPVESLVALCDFAANDHGSIGGRPFFVAGDEKRDVDGGLGVGSHKFFAGHDHGRQRSFHVAGATAEQLAIAVAGHEGVAGPGLDGACGHHIGMACEDQRGLFPLTQAGPEIGHARVSRATFQRFAHEPQRRKPLAHEQLTAFVQRCDGWAGDQFFGQAQRG